MGRRESVLAQVARGRWPDWRGAGVAGLGSWPKIPTNRSQLGADVASPFFDTPAGGEIQAISSNAWFAQIDLLAQFGENPAQSVKGRGIVKRITGKLIVFQGDHDSPLDIEVECSRKAVGGRPACPSRFKNSFSSALGSMPLPEPGSWLNRS